MQTLLQDSQQSSSSNRGYIGKGTLGFEVDTALGSEPGTAPTFSGGQTWGSRVVEFLE